MEVKHDRTTIQTLLKLYDVLCGLKKRKNKICVQTLTMGSYPPSNAKIKSDSAVSRQERMSQLVPAVESDVRKPSKKDAMCDCCDLCFCFSQEEVCVKKHASEDRNCKRKRSSDRGSSADMPKRYSSQEMRKQSSEEIEPLIQRKRSSSEHSFRKRLSSENISQIIHKAASERSLASVKSDTRLSTGSEDVEDDQKIIDECDLDEGRCKADAECKCCKFCKCYKEREEEEDEVKTKRTSEPKKQSKKSVDTVKEESPKKVSNKLYFDENYNRYKEISDSIILEEPSPPKQPSKKQTPTKAKKKASVKKSKKGKKKQDRQKSITPSRENLHSHSYHRLENHYLTTVKSDSDLSIKSDVNAVKSELESDSDKSKKIKRKLSSDSVKSTNSDGSEGSIKSSPEKLKSPKKRDSEKSKSSKKRDSEKSTKSKKSVKSCPGSEEVESLKKRDSDGSNETEIEKSPKPSPDEKVEKSKNENDTKVDEEEFKGGVKRIVVKKGGCDIFPLNKKERHNPLVRRKFEDDSSIAGYFPQETCCVPQRCVPRVPTCPSPCLPPPCCHPCPPLCTYNLSADSLPKQISEASLYFMNKKPKIFCKTIVTSKGQVTICRSDKSKNKKWDFTKKGMKCISYETKDPDSKVMKKSEICFETEEDLVRALFAARNFKKKLQKSWNSHHRIEDKKAKPFKHSSDFKIQHVINKSESPKDNSFYYPKSYVKRVKNFKNIQRKPIRRTQFAKSIQVAVTKQTKNMAVQTTETKNSKDACTSFDNVTKSPKVSFSDQNELKNYKIIVRIPTPPESSGTVKSEIKSQEKGIIDLFLNQTTKKEDVSKVEDIIKNLFDTLFVQKAEQLIRQIEEKTKKSDEKKNVPLIQGSQIKMIRAFEQIYGNRRRVEKHKSSLSFGGIDVLNSTIDSDLKSEILDRKNDSKDKISINLFDRFKYLEKDSIDLKNETKVSDSKTNFEGKESEKESNEKTENEKFKESSENQNTDKLYANTGHKDWKSYQEQKPKLDKMEGFRFKMDSNLGLGVPNTVQELKETKTDAGGQKNFLNAIKLALEEYEEYEKDSIKEKNVSIANPVIQELTQKNDFFPTKWQMTKSMENTLKQTSLAPFLNLPKDEKNCPSCSGQASVKAKGDMGRTTFAYPCFTSLVQNNLPIWTIDSYLNSLHKLSETLDTQLVQIKRTFDSKLHFMFRNEKESKNEKTTFIQKELVELKDKIKQNPFLELRREISSNKSLSHSEQNRLMASIDSEVKKLSSIEERVDTIIEHLKNNVECDSKRHKSPEKKTNSKLCVLRLERIGQILQKELVNIQSILSEKEEFAA